MSKSTVLMWFRRDLRLEDNLALQAAINSGARVIPLFILDPLILNSDYVSVPRLQFLLNGLQALDDSLRSYQSRLLIRQGNPFEVLQDLVQRYEAKAVYFNRDYSPYARQRDAKIEGNLEVETYRFDDAVLHQPGTVMKKDGDPYTVFTPFKKQLLTLEREPVASGYLERGDFYPFEENDVQSIPTIEDLGFKATIPLPDSGEKAGMKRLNQFLEDHIYHYGESRNRLVAEPWTDTKAGSSYLSPYLHLGMVSPRQVYWAAREAYRKAPHKTGRQSIEIFISEIIWREFYMHILFHFPHVMHGNFRPEYDNLAWENDISGLEAWKNGMTGYPVVDAAMRQLKAIGWMPNRARMIVASFLTKDLLIHWQKGERHFMKYLIDGDPAANNGGWQWAAGTGTDAQPYFRIFNPISQSKKFDPDGDYIRHWIPELQDVDTSFIHTPWTMDNPPLDYPAPIIDHQFARQRTLAAFKAIKEAKK